ncbi:MAG: 3-phosphoserine/phosphohydroxythreonine transaminase [Oscillospiraceae bacterium]|nr:3-phosphoserine/phosphohydroxythreonine transaminase [Oscillospiraceae bacterium]
MARVYNFSAGPSTLPESVLKRAAAEMLEYGSYGQSVLEMSHRSKEYDEIFTGCVALLRKTMSIPDNYKVLFVGGGASMQFGMVPKNLMTVSGKADYIVSGQFSERAFKEAKLLGDAACAASSKDDNFSRIPVLDKSKFNPTADYLHICQNNTIFGTRYAELPDTGNVPLVSDMSSCILSEPFDVSKFGLIYAGAQKNMAPSGVCVVIIRDDLLEREPAPGTPTMLQYKTYAKNNSMYNTPPTYNIYMLGLVLEWIQNDIGGLEKMKLRNEKKAGVLYDYLDSTDFYKAPAAKEFRSIMNVTFVTGDADLDKKFVSEARAAGFYNLAGHRDVGGMRASIYNAMPPEGLDKLVEFMADFEKKNRR